MNSFIYEPLHFSRSYVPLLLALCCLWLVVEFIFYLRLNLHLLPRINKISCPAAYPQHPEIIFKQMIQKLEGLVGEGHYCWKRFFSWWFRGAPFEEIHYNNLFEWLAWSMFVENVETLSKKKAKHVKSIIKLLELKLNHKFPMGYNAEVKAVRYTIEPLKICFRPLLLYLAMFIIKTFGDAILYLNGFSWYTTKGFGYWYRSQPKNQTVEGVEDPLPMVYFHGLGTGIVLCLRLVLRLSKGRASFLIEMKHVSPTLTFEAVGHSELPYQIRKILQKHGYSKCSAVGHSFGSVCVGWMVKYIPQTVGQAVFLDPVCFLHWLPDIHYNFLYREPNTMLEWVMSRLVSLEPTISHTLRRQFWWYQNYLDFEHLHCPAVVNLGAKDEVFPAKTVRGYFEMHLQKEDIKAAENLVVLWEPEHSHGRILISKRAQKKLVDSIDAQQRKQAKCNTSWSAREVKQEFPAALFS